MKLNAIVFPSKKSSYTAETMKGQLIWIPKIQYNHSKPKKPLASLISKQQRLRMIISPQLK
jgi:hypothetical protein